MPSTVKDLRASLERQRRNPLRWLARSVELQFACAVMVIIAVFAGAFQIWTISPEAHTTVLIAGAVGGIIVAYAAGWMKSRAFDFSVDTNWYDAALRLPELSDKDRAELLAAMYLDGGSAASAWLARYE